MQNIKSLGIDIGSVTLKTVLTDENGRLLHSIYVNHFSQPLPVLVKALKELGEHIAPDELLTAAVTGSGRELVHDAADVPVINEIVAQAAAAVHSIKNVRTIIEIGGQDSKYIRLGDSPDPANPVLLEQKMNDVCAAGTGAFVTHQAEKMGVPIEDFGTLALQSDDPASVAGRCAVFAKTDVSHLRQQGTAPCDIAAGLCNAIVRNYISQFAKGSRLETPIVFQGGLAANGAVVRAFRKFLKVGEKNFIVPADFAVTGAAGAALLGCRLHADKRFSLKMLLQSLSLYPGQPDRSCRPVSGPAPLTKGSARIHSLERVRPESVGKVFAGIDVGSTSSCAALLDTEGRLVASSYVFNRNDVIESALHALDKVKRNAGENLNSISVQGAGVTGSGRKLVAQYVGADVVRDEISAQAKAAVRMVPDVDTIFEIGGQDSKYIRIAHGRVADFEMNRVCAAGTGSFLQEQADRLNEKVENLSGLAFRSSSPADLGSRCTVFMESDLIHHQQTGTSKEDLAAGLSYSVARNYLEKVVSGRFIGDKIVFLGGVAFNGSVVSAFENLLGRQVIVPENHAISAAIGAALAAKEKSAEGSISRSMFRGFDKKREPYEISSFQCRDCPNNCRINRVVIGDTVSCYGGACGKHEGGTLGTNAVNLLEKRNELMLSYMTEQPDAEETVGIPRVLLCHEFFPLWCVFLQELGCRVVLSDPTSRKIADTGLEKSPIENCFACKIVYGHLDNLFQKGVDKLFFPSVVESERRVKDLEHNYACPHIQTIPSLVTHPHIEVLSPVMVRDTKETQWRDELIKTGKKLGKPADTVKRAVRSASEALTDFRTRCEDLGRKYLDGAGDRPVVVVMGKVYNVCDPELNLNIAKKLLRLGAFPVPFDCLPLSAQKLDSSCRDMIWNAGQDLLRAAVITAENENLHPLWITNFGCGPDSFIAKYLNEIFRDKSFLMLEVDEHTSDVGVVTRLEAFLSSVRRAGKGPDMAEVFKPFVPVSYHKAYDNIFYVPQCNANFRVMKAAFDAAGLHARHVPPHDEKTLKLSSRYCLGRECLPYIMYLGDAIRMTKDPEFDPEKAVFCIPGSNLSCRVSAYPTAIRLVLRDLGFPDVPVFAPRVSMDKDEMSKSMGIGFGINFFRGVIAAELLGKLLRETRPYESQDGESSKAYEEGIENICQTLGTGSFWKALRETVETFDRIEKDTSERKPVIGLVGDEYTRCCSFANNNFIEQAESQGVEVWNGAVWSNYLEFQRVLKPRKMLERKRYGTYLFDCVKSLVERFQKGRIEKMFRGRLQYSDPGFREMFGYAAEHFDPRIEPLIMVGISQIVHLVKSGVDGIASLGAFQCVIESVISARLRRICRENGNLPLLQLLFDFQKRTHQQNRIEAFIHQVKQYHSTRNRV